MTLAHFTIPTTRGSGQIVTNRRLELALLRLPGVHRVSLNTATEMLFVEYDSGVRDHLALRAACIRALDASSRFPVPAACDRRLDRSSAAPLWSPPLQALDTAREDPHVRRLVTGLVATYFVVAVIGVAVSAVAKLRWMELAFAVMAITGAVALGLGAQRRRPATPAAGPSSSPPPALSHADLARHG